MGVIHILCMCAKISRLIVKQDILAAIKFATKCCSVVTPNYFGY